MYRCGRVNVKCYIHLACHCLRCELTYIRSEFQSIILVPAPILIVALASIFILAFALALALALALAFLLILALAPILFCQPQRSQYHTMVVDGKPAKVMTGSAALLASVMSRPKKFSEYDFLSQILSLVANPIIVI